MPKVVEKVKKVGTQLLVPPALKARAEAVAARRGSSVASVWLAALERGLPAIEKQYAEKERGE